MRRTAATPHKKTARQGAAARKLSNEDAPSEYAAPDHVSSSDAQIAASDFTKLKMAWLDSVVADAEVSHAAFRVAYVLVSRYLNRKTGTAWPALATLANDIGSDPRTVGRHVALLEQRGYLTKKRGGDGHPNTYAIVNSDRTKMSDLKLNRPDKNVRSERRLRVVSDRTKDAFQTGQKCPTNPLEEPSEVRGEPYRLPPIEPFDISIAEIGAGGSAPEALPPCAVHDDNLGPGLWEPCPEWEPDNEPDKLCRAPEVVRDFHASLPRSLRATLTYGDGGYVFANEPDVETARSIIPLLRRCLGEQGEAIMSLSDDRYDLACLLAEAEALLPDLDGEQANSDWPYDADAQYA